MKALLGNSCFTKYAEGIYTLLGQKEGFTTEQFFHELPFQFLEMKGGSAIPGSIAYITNIPQYLSFKPSGNEAGDNIFYIADNQCLGFGSNYKKGPQSWQAVEKELFRSLCDPTDVEYLHDEHKLLSSYYQADKQAFEINRRTEQQENCNFHYIFDAEKIKRFRKTGEVIL